MTKPILKLAVAVLLMTMTPVSLKAADAEMTPVEQTIEEDITLSVEGQWVTVSGGQGRSLEVVSLTGRRVLTIKVESPAQRIELNVPKGCYILKIGKVVRKVAIQ